MQIKEITKTITRNNTIRYYFKLYSIYTFNSFDCSIEVIGKEIANAICCCKHGMFQQSKKKRDSYCRHLNCAKKYLVERKIIK